MTQKAQNPEKSETADVAEANMLIFKKFEDDVNKQEVIQVGELIAALEKVQPDRPISISAYKNNDRMTVAYMCSDKECGALHLAGGRDIEFNYKSASEIFMNRANTDDTSSVKKSELLAILKKLKPDTRVLVATMDDEGFFALATVFVCSGCDSIHLSANYVKQR